MLFGIKRQVVIQAGRAIEIKSDELPVGSLAEVIVFLDNNNQKKYLWLILSVQEKVVLKIRKKQIHSFERNEINGYNELYIRS
jgi:hypothetical protein